MNGCCHPGLDDKIEVQDEIVTNKLVTNSLVSNNFVSRRTSVG